MKEILEGEGYELLIAHDGVDALLQIQRERPLATVMDAALPKMYGFEICEFMKRSDGLKHIKVLLVVSENGRQRYRRSPQSTYGADDFVDEGRFEEDLRRKLEEILSGPTPSAGEGEETPAPSPRAVPAREAPLSQPPEQEAPVPGLEDDERGAATDPEEAEREKARRLARIIVSDIALYNEAVIDKGVRSGQLKNLIRDDLEEGYKLFRSRVPENIVEETDYIREALDNLVKKKRTELGLPDSDSNERIGAGTEVDEPPAPDGGLNPEGEGFSDDDF
jgi:CheY-like chemotaxis protein